ncbi:Ras guanine nucleotide exchange factor [Pelomyxa schiedti]|nr:Ras guanine nucleotide exchange factor [Pelomyxa schiedti]
MSGPATNPGAPPPTGPPTPQPPAVLALATAPRAPSSPAIRRPAFAAPPPPPNTAPAVLQTSHSSASPGQQVPPPGPTPPSTAAAATTATTPAPNPPANTPHHGPPPHAAPLPGQGSARAPPLSPLSVALPPPLHAPPPPPMSLDHTAPPDYLHAASPPAHIHIHEQQQQQRNSHICIGIGIVIVIDGASAVAVDIPPPPPPPEHVRPSPPNKELPATPQREPSGHTREQPQPQQQPQGPLSVSDTGGVASGGASTGTPLNTSAPIPVPQGPEGSSGTSSNRWSFSPETANKRGIRRLLSSLASSQVPSDPAAQQATADADHPLHDETVHAVINLPPQVATHVSNILVEGIFVNMPIRAVMFQSGKTLAMAGQQPSVEFATPYTQPPKVFAWSFGYGDQTPMASVPSAKLTITLTGFSIAIDGNFDICWVAFNLPTTNPVLKEAIRLILTHPPELSPKLQENVEESVREVSVNGTAADGQTLLHAASYAGNLELIMWLLKQGTEIDPKDELGWTPLMCAVNQGHFSAAQCLMEKGASCLQMNVRKQTILHLLAKSYNSAHPSSHMILHSLLSSEIDINGRSDSGDTDLMFACSSNNVQMDLITTLLEAKADPNISNFRGDTPLSKATASNNQELIDALSLYSAGPSQTPQDTAEAPTLPQVPAVGQQQVSLELARDIFSKFPEKAVLFQSGRFKAQYVKQHIDFTTSFARQPRVYAWSISGTQSLIAEVGISLSLTGFDILLTGTPYNSALNWVAFLTPQVGEGNTETSSLTQQHTVEQKPVQSGPPILLVLSPKSAEASSVHVLEPNEPPLDIYEKFTEYYTAFEEQDSDDNVRWSVLASNCESLTTKDYTIRGGNIFKLVQYLTHQNESDMEFVHSFLISHPAFIDELKFLDLLTVRYFIRKPEQFDTNVFNIRVRNIIRLRIVNILKTWVSLYYEDFAENPTMLQKLSEMLLLFSKTCKAASLVLKVLERQKAALAAPVHLGEPPPPSILLAKGEPKSLLDFHPEELARQMSLIEWNIWKRIRPKEFIRNSWTKPTLKDKLAPNITAMINESNKRTLWAIAEILRHPHEKERAIAIHRLILTAEASLKIRNFNGLMELVSAMQNSAIHRLKRSWRHLPASTWEIYDKHCALFEARGNFQIYREAIKQAVPPCIPYLGMILTDLTFANDGNPDLIAGTQLVNFAKYRNTSNIVKALQLWQHTGPNFTPVEILQHALANGTGPVVTVDEAFEISTRIEPPIRDSAATTKSTPSTTDKVSKDIFNKDDNTLAKAKKKAYAKLTKDSKS